MNFNPQSGFRTKQFVFNIYRRFDLERFKSLDESVGDICLNCNEWGEHAPESSHDGGFMV